MPCSSETTGGGDIWSAVPIIPTPGLVLSGCSKLQNDFSSPQQSDFLSAAELSQGELKTQTPENRKGSRRSFLLSVNSLLHCGMAWFTVISTGAGYVLWI